MTGTGNFRSSQSVADHRSMFTRRRMIAIAAIAALGLALASVFADGGAHRYDRSIMLLLRNSGQLDDPLGPGWFEDIMRDFTALGGIAVIIGASLVLAVYWVLRRRYVDIAVLAFSIAGGQAISALIKLFVARPRPDLVSHEAQIYSASFPSGHTLMATVGYITFAMLLAADVADRRVREYLLAVAWTTSIAVGCSRVYLGVHWPSDVLAGWAIGALWMLVISTVLPRLRAAIPA
ncbi:MAG: phosphatase PAP2 family protein [Tahibacter sp.]